MKTGADLVNVVCLWVDNKIKFCSTVIIAFDTYQEISLKSATRNKRYSKSNLQHYNITSSTNISRQSLRQLAHKKKQTIPDWATNGSFEKLFITQKLVISWPFYTWWDNQQSPRSRHIIDHCITSSKRDGKRVWVYASDADVVVLLIAHRNLLCAAEMFTLETLLKILTSIVFLSFLGIKNLFFWYSIVSMVAIQLENFIMCPWSHGQNCFYKLKTGCL